SNSMRVKPQTRRTARREERMTQILSAGPGKEVRFGLPNWASARADGLRLCRSHACGRSISNVTRQAGLLAYGSWRLSNDLPAAGLDQVACSGLGMFEDLADYSGGPATDSHRFPFCSQLSGRKAGNLSRLKRLLAIL